MFGGNLAEASAGAAREIAARLGTCFVHGADELARTLLDAQGGAVTVDHPHVGTIAVEAHETIDSVTEAGVVVALEPHPKQVIYDRASAELLFAAGPQWRDTLALLSLIHI